MHASMCRQFTPLAFLEMLFWPPNFEVTLPLIILTPDFFLLFPPLLQFDGSPLLCFSLLSLRLLAVSWLELGPSFELSVRNEALLSFYFFSLCGCAPFSSVEFATAFGGP